MINRLRSVLVKELIQFTRDPLLLGIVLIVPTIELILIGGRVGGGTANIPMAVVDLDRSEASRNVTEAIENTRELRVAAQPDTLDEASDLLDIGKVSGIVVLPDNFEIDLRGGQTPGVQLILDGTNVVAAAEVQAAAQGAIESMAYGISVASNSANIVPGGVDLRHEALYNQALDAGPFELTSLLGFIVFEIVTLAAVMSIVKERELGTLEQVAITPLRQAEVIIGKALSPMLIGLVNFFVLFTAVRLLFDLPLRGSIVLLTGLTVIYLVAEVCVALMISAVSRTQGQAITIVFLWVMIAVNMSGYMVPVTRLPDVLRIVSNALPLQHYITIVRGIMLKGAGLDVLWPNLLALIVLDVVVVSVTAMMMRRLGT